MQKYQANQSNGSYGDNDDTGVNTANASKVESAMMQ